jgi:hypothetical protein
VLFEPLDHDLTICPLRHLLNHGGGPEISRNRQNQYSLTHRYAP